MRSYSHLSEDERDQIGILRAAGQSNGAIALGALSSEKQPSPGSCSGTHSPPAGIRRFTPPEPINCAGGVKRSSNERPIYVFSCVIGWPRDGRPEISGWLKSGDEPRLQAIGCETIYAFIYRTAQKAEALWRYLTRRHKRRRPRRARPSRDTIKDRASIHDRPKAIESRGEAGHREGDLIICKCTRPVLVLHERKSRVTLAARLTGKTAAETISAMLAVFGRIDPHLRKSITFDNDSAFAQHGLLRTMRDMTTWSAMLMPHGKKAASKMPMDACVDGCRATSISTAHPTRTSRRSSSRRTSRPASASGSRRHSKPCLPSLEKTSKSASLSALRFAPESRITPTAHMLEWLRCCGRGTRRAGCGRRRPSDPTRARLWFQVG